MGRGWIWQPRSDRGVYQGSSPLSMVCISSSTSHERYSGSPSTALSRSVRRLILRCWASIASLIRGHRFHFPWSPITCATVSPCSTPCQNQNSLPSSRGIRRSCADGGENCVDLLAVEHPRKRVDRYANGVSDRLIRRRTPQRHLVNRPYPPHDLLRFCIERRR